MNARQWARDGEHGRQSQEYYDVLRAVERIIIHNSKALVTGGASLVAERILYELVDVLGMMPEHAAQKYIAQLKREQGILTDSVDDLGSAAGAG